MQRSKVVSDEIRRKCEEEGIDILLMQEPYNLLGNVTGFSLGTKIITGSGNREQAMAAIAVFNKDIEVLKISQFCDAHIVCLETRSAMGPVYMVACYFQDRDPVEGFVERLDTLLATLKGKKVLIGVDSNSKSSLWHSTITDARGIQVEDFVSRNRLFILNEPGNPSTFCHNGESNIDITLVTGNLLPKASMWKVRTSWTSSDHRVLTCVLSDHPEESPERKPEAGRYALRRANWKEFDETLGRVWQQLAPRLAIGSREGIDTTAADITRGILRACNAAIPKKKVAQRCIPWWTPELTARRKQVHRSRKRFQRADDPVIREELKAIHGQLRREYFALIKREKLQSFQGYVTEYGNSDPWGTVYKLQTKKMRTEQILSTLNYQGGVTTDWEGTSSVLLNSLLPDDSTEDENEDHRTCRRFIAEAPIADDEEPFAYEEVQNAIFRMKKGKAPGLDKIEPEILQRAWPVIGRSLLDLYNGCLKYGAFPKEWKKGRLTILMKGQDKDPKDPKSYRPIMLLPVMGKALERLVIDRIMYRCLRGGYLSDKQYGFRPERSTEDAIHELINRARNSEKKYVLGIFLDISGAFDNLWWPSILSCLKQMECPPNIYRLIENYFNEREAILTMVNGSKSKAVTKGCPQGSVMGPYLWNIVFNGCLGSDTDEIAYADDKVILIHGDSRAALERQAQEAIDRTSEWLEKNKMELSATKTVMLQLKGIYDYRRPPVVRVRGQSIKMVQQVKYLGVQFGERLSVLPHVRATSDKCKKIFHSLTRISRSDWGLKQKALKVIYRGVIEALMTYAAGAWAQYLSNQSRQVMLSAQRNILLRMLKGYSTVPTEAVSVLAGVLPIDILTQERARKYLMRKGSEVVYGDLRLSSSDYEVNDGWETLDPPATRHKTHSDTELYRTTATMSGPEKIGDRKMVEIEVAHCGNTVMRRRFHVIDQVSPFQTELWGVWKILEWSTTEIGEEPIRIEIRTKGVLQAIRNPTNLNPIVGQIRKKRRSPFQLTLAGKSKKVIDKYAEVPEIEGYYQVSRNWVQSTLRKASLNHWQERWDNADTARRVHSFIPDVKSRMKRPYWYPSRAICQFITGHGNFGSYLYRFGKKDNADCPCGEEEDDPDHEIYKCILYREQRTRLEKDVVRHYLEWPVSHKSLIDDKVIDTFQEFCESILKSKETTSVPPPRGRDGNEA